MATQKAIRTQLSQAPSSHKCGVNLPFPAMNEGVPFGLRIAGDTANITMMAIPDDAAKVTQKAIGNQLHQALSALSCSANLLFPVNDESVPFGSCIVGDTSITIMTIPDDTAKVAQKAIKTQLSQASSPRGCSENTPFQVNDEGVPLGLFIAGYPTNITMIAIPDDADSQKDDSTRACTPSPRKQTSYIRLAAKYLKKSNMSPSHWPHAASRATAIAGPLDPSDRAAELPINQQHASSAQNPDDLAQGGLPAVVISSRGVPKGKPSPKLVKCDPYQGCTSYIKCQRAFDSSRSGMT